MKNRVSYKKCVARISQNQFHSIREGDTSKKSYVDEQHFISDNVERPYDETKGASKKDTVDRNRENIGNMMYGEF